MSLFTIDLERELNFPMAKSFLGIDDPENERPQESSLLDFKQNIPEDFGDTVTSFSNTYGGLAILGVKGKKSHSVAIPDTITGIPGTKEEIKGKIVSRVLNTVRPRPLFSVGIVAVEGETDKFLAVVRVEEGFDTPYMYIKGEENKISVRIGDSNRRASLEQITGLFEKAHQARRGVDDILQSLGDLYVFTQPDALPTEARAGSFHRLSWAPARPLNFRLDLQTEESFMSLIARCFPRDELGTSKIETQRTAAFVDFDLRNREWDYHRKWRLSKVGATGFISKIGRRESARRGSSQEDRAGNWIVDALSFVKLTCRWAKEKQYFGSGTLIHTMSFGGPGGMQIKAEMPTDELDRYDGMVGISIPGPLGSRGNPSSLTYDVSIAHLDEEDEVVRLLAESFLYHFRDLNWQVNWNKLHEQIFHLNMGLEAQITHHGHQSTSGQRPEGKG